MPSEGIGIKGCNGTMGTQQFHAQMGMAHMRTDSGMGGLGSPRAPLHLAAIDLVGIPYADT